MSATCATCGQPSRPADGTYLGRRVCRRDACLVYIDGHEAGRLAAIRADVEWGLNRPRAGFLDRLEAARADVHAARKAVAQTSGEVRKNWETRLSTYIADAEALEMRVADTTRWLEATR